MSRYWLCRMVEDYLDCGRCKWKLQKPFPKARKLAYKNIQVYATIQGYIYFKLCQIANYPLEITNDIATAVWSCPGSCQIPEMISDIHGHSWSSLQMLSKSSLCFQFASHVLPFYFQRSLFQVCMLCGAAGGIPEIIIQLQAITSDNSCRLPNQTSYYSASYSRLIWNFCNNCPHKFISLLKDNFQLFNRIQGMYSG